MFLIIQFPPSIPLKSLVDFSDDFFILKLYVAILCDYKGLRNPFLVSVVPILYPLKKTQKSKDFLVFSGWVNENRCPEMGWGQRKSRVFLLDILFCFWFGFQFCKSTGKTVNMVMYASQIL